MVPGDEVVPGDSGARGDLTVPYDVIAVVVYAGTCSPNIGIPDCSPIIEIPDRMYASPVVLPRG